MEAQEDHKQEEGHATSPVKPGSLSVDQKREAETSPDIAQLVASNNTKQLADLFLRLKHGDVHQTYDLLRGVIAMLPMDHKEDQVGAKRARADHYEEPQVEVEIADDFVIHDQIDETPITAVMLVPNDVGLVSHIIGKQGSSVMEIKQRTGARVQVERTDHVPPGAQDRNVFILTNVQNATVAMLMILKKIGEKLPTNVLSVKTVVPNELVSKIIGKGGATIKKLQTDSGATVQVAKDLATDHMPVGRTVFLNGTVRQIAVAHYNIMRTLAMDKDFPADWRGGIPMPAGAPRPPMGRAPLPSTGAMPQAGRHGPPRMSGMQPTMMGAAPGYGPIGPAGPPPMVPGAAAGGAMQAPTRFETVVPEYSVSYIIGKKGAYINEIQRTTATNLEVAKTSDNGVERRITITGTPDNIQRATHMLEEKVRDWQSRAAHQHPAALPQPYPPAVPGTQPFPQAGLAPGTQPYPMQQPQPYAYPTPYPGQQQYGGLAAQPPHHPYQNYGR